jgi:hypothetical protein
LISCAVPEGAPSILYQGLGRLERGEPSVALAREESNDDIPDEVFGFARALSPCDLEKSTAQGLDMANDGNDEGILPIA